MIIKDSGNEGDLVLDTFCDCGTAIMVAQKLKRKWIGVDVSPTAYKLMFRRMVSSGVNISVNDIVGLQKSKVEIRSMQLFEFQNWMIGKILGTIPARKTRIVGIDGYLFGCSQTQVKQSE
jgi:hypothetical protein